jgi:outer membrane protein assembly factor BamD (BamD/ComL family)
MRPEDKQKIGYILVCVFALVLILIGAFIVYPAVMNTSATRLYERGVDLLEAHNAEAAVATFREVVRDYENTPAAERARTAIADWEPYTRKALEVKAEADALLKQGEFEAAWDLYNVLVSEYPQSRYGVAAQHDIRTAANHMCREYMDQIPKEVANYQWRTAKNLYESVLKVDPDYPGAQEGLLIMTDKVGLFERSMTAGWKALSDGKYAEARKLFETALQVEPNNLRAFKGRADALTGETPPEGMVLIEPHYEARAAPIEIVDPAAPTEPVRKGPEAPSRPGPWREGAPAPDAPRTPERPEAPKTRTVRIDPSRAYDRFGLYHGAYIDAHEVTNAEYAAFVAATGHAPPPHWKGTAPPDEMADLPVVCVSRTDAEAYARFAGKRLPSAAEWIWAARGQQRTAYPWGDRFDPEKANFGGETLRPGTVATDRSPAGAFDTAGNVAEWTSDNASPSDEVAVLCGNSFAGLEMDRPERVVPDDIAGPDSPPEEVVLVPHARHWGIEIRATRELTWLLFSSYAGQPRVHIRKYDPAEEAYAYTDLYRNVGQEIKGIATMVVPTDKGRKSVRMEVDTGYTVVDIHHPDDYEKIAIEVEDEEGNRLIVPKTRRPPVDDAAAHDDPARGALYDALLGDLRRTPLARSAQVTFLKWAPSQARCLNVGFRCARDVVWFAEREVPAE